jgi:hypothetical protein
LQTGPANSRRVRVAAAGKDGGQVRRSGTCRGVQYIGLAALAAGLCGPAHGQYIETYLPAGVPGLDRQQGVTVLSRLRPLYQEPGVRLGSFLVHGGLDERLGYNSNITATTPTARSPFAETTGSISATSDWSRNRLGFSANLDNYTYFDAPAQNYTNYNVSLGGGYTILRHDLNVGYSHQRAHELGTDIGAVASSTPVTYDLDIVRSDYTIESGRFQFTPNVDIRHYSFGNAVVNGQPVSQQYRDRDVLSGGITTRYALSEERGIVVVLQGSRSHFLRPQAGMPSANSKSVLLLTGLDYQAAGPWRYRLLAGAEVREFAAAQYGTRAAPVFEGSVIYTPTGLTTITGSVRREIEDPQSEATSGYLYTTAAFVVDHEYRRNILLQARGTVQRVDYFQSSAASTAYSFGGSVNWLVNRHLRISASYDFTRQISSGTQNAAALQPGARTSPSYTRNVFLLGAHFRL